MDSRISARSLAAMLGGWRVGEPAYEAMADGIRLLCLDNRIAARTGLPAERELATHLQVSRTTVAAAYRSLRDSGHIESLRGSGSVTVPVAHRDMGSLTNSDSHGDQDHSHIDLHQASPDAWPGLASVIAEVAGSATTLMARSGYDLVGSLDLRQAIATRYTDAGIPTSADQVLVTNGAQSAIYLLASVLVGRGDRVLMETPTYPHAADAMRRVGARVVGVPVSSESGWDLDRAQQAFARTMPVLAYFMPDFHNPTGASMTEHEREVIERAAAGVGSVLVVDETTADLNIDRPHPLRLLGKGSASAGANVVRLGSLGKTVWGGLRIGWMRADSHFLRRVVDARFAHELGNPAFEQAVAARLLPRMPEIIAQRAFVLRESRDALIDAVARHLPSWSVPSPHGGVSVWAELDAPLSGPLTMAARAEGVSLISGPRFALDGGHERRLRIPFTGPARELERAVEILGEVWPRVRAGAPHAVFSDVESVV